MATIEKRTSNTGQTTYRVKVRLRGASPRTQTFKRLTDAKAWAAKTEADLGHGVFVPTTADKRRTFADLIDKYRKDYLPVKRRNRDSKGQAIILDWWRANYGHLSLDRLKPEAFTEARAKLAKRENTRTKQIVSGATVNRYLMGASAVCKWGWKELGWLPSNPVQAITKMQEGPGVVRFLSDDERKRLLAACKASDDPNIECAVVVALATGLRYSNVRFLKWEDVDRTQWALTIRETKNGDARRVPLVEAAQRALKAQWDADPTRKEWVFKGRKDDAPADFNGKPWRAVRDAAGLSDFRFHDLRHTTASYLTMAGASLAEVAEAMGHKTLVMTKRYAHQTSEHVRSTFERMADKLGKGEEE